MSLWAGQAMTWHSAWRGFNIQRQALASVLGQAAAVLRASATTHGPMSLTSSTNSWRVAALVVEGRRRRAENSRASSTVVSGRWMSVCTGLGGRGGTPQMSSTAGTTSTTTTNNQAPQQHGMDPPHPKTVSLTCST